MLGERRRPADDRGEAMTFPHEEPPDPLKVVVDQLGTQTAGPKDPHCICSIAEARRSGAEIPDIFHPPCSGTGYRPGTPEFEEAMRPKP